jgi:chromosome segregation protein
LIDKEIKELRHKSQQLQTRLHEVEIIATKYNYELSQCHEQITSQFGMSISDARKLYRDESTDILMATSRDLENQIAQLGPVNPAAVEEFQHLNERYQFLQTQFNDLVAAKDYLDSIIAEINVTMAKQFKTAFHSIDTHFQDIFSKLFGGGTASLRLLDSSNLLETGIDIEVQPPGKKQQNLALLSGGERSLTVIALLLAFLSHRPAPFCVVDEIDAALDEANVERFSEFIRNYAEKTQFKVVTHRKGTMEVANVMHGVTMEQSGISKLVSVKLMDKAG